MHQGHTDLLCKCWSDFFKTLKDYIPELFDFFFDKTWNCAKNYASPEHFLRVIWNAVSWDTVLSLANKTRFYFFYRLSKISIDIAKVDI